MMARTIEQISAFTWVQVKENSRNHNHLLLKTSLEEIQSIGDFIGETLEIEPEIEGGIRDGLDVESHFAETLDDVVALFTEMRLQSDHFFPDFLGFKHLDCGFLEGDVGTAVEVGTA